ncbi:MAG TPA: histidine phosphatase family protein [Beutenbergiaceae bacterium]|nr:histidine phosphatase family protein [Beutenbergiaceae bacterium]
MPTLVLLRHAKAEAAGPSDFERKLSAPGRSQARRVAAHLVAEGLVPDVVLCSAALRARQTWEQVEAGLAERGHPGEPVVHVAEELYSARPETVADLVAAQAAGEVTLVVGHEPTMSMTAAALAGPESDEVAVMSAQVGIPTATAAVLEAGAWPDFHLPGAGASAVRLRELLRTPVD